MSTFKIVSLGIRTLAKPIGNRIKAQAREHPSFRHICVNFAQRLHRIDMRWRIGLLQDPAIIDRQVKREQAEAESKRSQSPTPVSTVKTREETEAEKKEAEEIRKKLKKGRPIKPLSEAKAIDFGASFISETFLFLVAAALVVGERWWSNRRAKERRDELDERLEGLVGEVEGLREKLAEYVAEDARNGGKEVEIGKQQQVKQDGQKHAEKQKQQIGADAQENVNSKG